MVGGLKGRREGDGEKEDEDEVGVEGDETKRVSVSVAGSLWMDGLGIGCCSIRLKVLPNEGVCCEGRGRGCVVTAMGREGPGERKRGPGCMRPAH